MFDKIYNNEVKFCGIGDNFNFKITIFYDKCRWVKLLRDAYIYVALIMLYNQAQIHYYANCVDSSTFEQFYTNMQIFFEGLQWQSFNLTN